MKLLFESWRKYIDEVCDDTEGAINIAQDVHATQTRRSGEPYFIHPEAVAKYVEFYGYSKQDDKIVEIVAYLHDSVEDAEDPEAVKARIKEECPEALPVILALSHDKKILPNYNDYIRTLLGDDLVSQRALIIKLLDMLHNSQDVGPGDRQYKKYHEALTSIQDHFGGKPPILTDEHWNALMDRLGKPSEENIQDRAAELENKR